MRHTGMRTILTLTAALALAGCAGSANKTPPPVASTTARPAVKLDAYARTACAKLDSAVGKRSNGDPIGANQDEFSAMTDAAQSQAPGLSALVLKYDKDGLSFDSAAPHLREWCYANTPG